MLPWFRGGLDVLRFLAAETTALRGEREIYLAAWGQSRHVSNPDDEEQPRTQAQQIQTDQDNNLPVQQTL